MDMEPLLGKRRGIKTRITKAKNWLAADGQAATVELLEAKLDTLKEKFKEWETYHELIMENDKENEQAHENEADLLEGSYHLLIAEINHRLKEYSGVSEQSSERSTNAGTSNHRLNVRLPEITLPQFDGKFENWRSFKDQFNARVGSNRTLQEVDKFQYLQSCLTGEASEAIAAFELTDYNYKAAWDLLEGKFDIPRQALRRHCALLLGSQKVNKIANRNLTELVNAVRQQIRSISSFGDVHEQFNGLISTIILNQLDNDLIFQWETSLQDNAMPSFDKLLEFLEKRGICANDIQSPHSDRPKTQQPAQKQTQYKVPKTHTFISNAVHKCPVCEKEHRIYTCPKFAEMKMDERRKIISKQMRCFNCLATGHGTRDCKGVPPIVSLSADSSEHDILPTALIHILDSSNQRVECRALLDTGSSKNFITADLAHKLQISQSKCSVAIGALNELSTVAHSKISGTIHSLRSSFKKVLQFLIVPQIASLIPNQQINRDSLELPSNIQLADPNFHRPAPIHLLLGSSTSISVLSVGQIKLRNATDAYAQKTLLGWIICGSIDEISSPSIARCNFASMMEDFKRFWEIEDIGSVPKQLSTVEEACEAHFRMNVSRTSTGRYMVALPFNELKEQLGRSHQMAERRLLALERRFQVDATLKTEYSAVMNEYIDLGHMKEVVTEPERGFYLPHHAVVKLSSQTTKVRVVFDGSAKSTSKISLNDCLMVGPTIQDNILTLVLRLRLYNYVFTGDIEKMYRQILVKPEDTIYQRILWRNKEEIKTYELQTVTFGLASAPYLATRCLQQLADDGEKQYPCAAKVLRRDLYVDDVLTGTDTLEEALQLRDELISLLKTGGFNLRQCASNSRAVIQDLPDCTINLQLLGGDDPALKTLGIHWNSQRDTIFYTVNQVATRERVTMRTIASDIARIFDPLGLLNPVIAHAKIIQQELWRLQLHWDDSVPLEIQTRWNTFANELLLLNNIEFNRKILQTDTNVIELHGFCDASERAYGACIYLRSQTSSGKIHTSLFCAKSRITPLKGSHTIPRLELCAAELLSSLYTTVTEATNLKAHRTVFWSDSTIVLHWIKTHTHLLQRFVANRVSKIQERTDPNTWRHVRSQDNPADAISRGQLPSQFLSNPLWKYGPDWLTEEEIQWPLIAIRDLGVIPELKKVTCLQTTGETNTLLTRYSSFERLRRIFALCFRWRQRTIQGHINIEELEAAEIRIIQIIQRTSFRQEISDMKGKQELSSNSHLRNLCPFLDTDDIIRVGGRLQNSDLDFNGQHPILLPKGNSVTHLIIKKVHEENLHSGIQTTLHLMRSKYWPLDGRNQVRHVIRNCIKCSRANPQSVNYRMGVLPKERVTQGKPFSHTGVDYCGPFFIKERRHRNRVKLKAWISIFVCFITKAVHIEVVSNLTTEDFLAALSRFISRHPACVAIHSDNGSNFVGAKNELTELFKFIDDKATEDAIRRDLNKRGIKWNFIPTASPHCGGIWEAAVKSCKHHLRRVMGNELLTYEQLNTLCVKIEGILNSRPLTPMSSDPNDLAALTPAHFLHGDTTRDLPSQDWTNIPTNRLSYWQHLDKIKQHFWNRWYKEYLNELTIRQKWVTGEHSIDIGSLVLLRDDNIPPLKWRLGRVMEVYPAKDGVIRKVKVRTASGFVERNVRRLAPLPIDNSADQGC